MPNKKKMKLPLNLILTSYDVRGILIDGFFIATPP
jgi:hypothetical protein